VKFKFYYFLIKEKKTIHKLLPEIFKKVNAVILYLLYTCTQTSRERLERTGSSYHIHHTDY